MVELFRRRAAGARITELQAFLMEAGIKTTRGNDFWHSAVIRKLLEHRAYLGEMYHGEYFNPAANPPLIDEAMWQRAQYRDQRPARKRGARPSLLRGILRCAGCQHLLYCGFAFPGSSRETRFYFCRGTRKGIECPAPARIEDKIAEPYIEAIFWQELERSRRRPAPQRLKRLEAVVRERERELCDYRDNARLPTVLGPDRFAEGLTRRAERLDRARAKRSRAQLGTAISQLPPLDQLRDQWPAMPNEARRNAITEVIDCAFLRKGPPTDAEGRLFVCARGQAPTDLPPPYHGQRFPRHAFDPSSVSPPLRLKRKLEKDLTPAELRETLALVLSDYSVWPGYPAFQAAGVSWLYEHVERHGGAERLALALGLAFQPPRHEIAGWPDERIRKELGGFVAGRREWPTWEDFKAHGHAKLRRAIRWSGGAERWAKEFDLVVPPGRYAKSRRSYPQLAQELREFTSGHGEWPSYREFKNAGLTGLYQAIRTSGMRERLAAEVGLRGG